MSTPIVVSPFFVCLSYRAFIIDFFDCSLLLLLRSDYIQILHSHHSIDYPSVLGCHFRSLAIEVE